MFDFDKALSAIRDEGVDGWLFYNVEHRDTISDLILGVDDSAVESSINSRPWVYLIEKGGKAVKIVHTIEQAILDKLPGEKYVYTNFSMYKSLLKGLNRYGKRFAVNFSYWNPFVSFLDHGFAVLIESLGFEPVSSEELVSAFLGTLNEAGVKSLEEAAIDLYKIVQDTWSMVIEKFSSGKRIEERDVQAWIMEMFKKRDLYSNEAPIVAAGRNSGNPHYSPGINSAVLKEGDVVQFDLWAKLKKPGAVYGDISWVGYLGYDVPKNIEEVFEVVTEARDKALAFVREKLENDEPVTGAEVDEVAREVIVGAGYGKFLKHRTGHSIGSEVHGYGVNLDSIEFPDRRKLREGSCFSIEPGIYMDDFGIRSEIDVYIWNRQVIVAGRKRQDKIMTPGNR